jgi:hypothetical protein
VGDVDSPGCVCLWSNLVEYDKVLLVMVDYDSNGLIVIYFG